MVSSHDIAIIGISGRFPGANTVDQFWANLEQGCHSITEVPEERWDHSQFYSSDPDAPNKSYCKRAGFLSDIDKFDPFFFGISPREAGLMAPQQRLLLEEAWKALEDAGYPAGQSSNWSCGVFIGAGPSDYLDVIEAVAGFADSSLLTGNTASTDAGRLASALNLNGPCLTIDTACSSSLVAVHLACQSIIRGEVKMALAGGAGVMTTPKWFIITSKTGLVSREGKCKAFDDEADGYVPGEAVGVVVLKSLSKALQEGDHIYGVVKGSGINHAGKLAHSPVSQTTLQLEVFEMAGIHPESISYVEAHGTGTRLGDALEIDALAASFRKYTPKKQFCPIGSVKTNIGHSGQPSGIASFIKVLLAMQNQKIPPSLNYARSNRLSNVEESPFYVNYQLKAWPASANDPRRAAVNSFGHSGTNAFVLIEEAPLSAHAVALRPHYLVNISGKTEEATRQRMADLDVWLRDHGDANLLPALCYTLSAGRSHFRSRASLIIRNLDDLRQKMHSVLQSGNAEDYYYNPRAHLNSDTETPPAILRSLLRLIGNGKRLDESSYKNALIGVAKFYVRGFDIDWEALYPNEDCHRLSLPPYPFARERHWISPLRKSGVANHPGAQERVPPAPTLYYHPVWLKEEGVVESASPAHPEVLVFDNNEEIFLEFRKGGQQAYLIKEGEAFAQIGENQYQLQPQNPEDYSRLLNHLGGRGVTPRRVVHLWSHHAEALDERHGDTAAVLEKKVSDHLISGVYSIFMLSKALSALSTRDEITLLYFYQSQEPFSHPQLAAVSGIARSIKHENPKLTIKAIQLLGDEFPPDRVIDIALREFRLPGNPEIRYANHQRYVRSFIPLNEAKAHLNRTEQKVPLKEAGVYLISGGAGGLGLIFASFLAKNSRARLVLVGRSELTPEKQQRLREIDDTGAQVVYCRADITRFDEVCTVVQKTKDKFGKIDGVIHAAGIIDAAWAINKGRASFDKVLAPKVAGTLNLDAATRAENLDFFVLFSSITSVTGNIGQCDYAAANRFMDGFAELREHWRALGKRQGRTVSINWPHWREGGMLLPGESAELMEQLLGLKLLSKEQGLEAFLVGLSAEQSQIAVLEGLEDKIRLLLGGVKPFAQSPQPAAAVAVRDERAVVAQAERDIAQMVSGLLQIEAGKLESDTDISEFGMNSSMFTQLVVQINRTYNLQLAPAIIFEHHTLRSLARFLVKEYGGSLFAIDQGKPLSQTPPRVPPAVPAATGVSVTAATPEQVVRSAPRHEPIAVVGVSGVFPQATDVAELWRILEAGTEVISEVPENRWDWRRYYGDPVVEEGRTLSKWGGFMAGVDRFDALFFNISPREAELMDPQQRIFMETVWKAIEDAGHKPSDLWGSSTGLFVGVQANDYAELLIQQVDAQLSTGLPHSMLANRVSYFFNFHGPSEAIDTACSSAAAAIHRAVQSIRNGESEQAIAGGVNIMLSPRPHLILSQMGMLSPDGKCRTFDKDANGYVRGEGVGAVLLKPLSRALEDGNPIYATILTTAENHGGRALSLLAPNPEAQAAAIVSACLQAEVEPETIGYIEAQGTGTLVGDSVEVSAFKMAFATLHEKSGKTRQLKHYCGIGSLKPNIGHLEAASGIAALIKVILAFKHRKLPASINIKELSPYIQLEDTPFYVVDCPTAWEPRLDEHHHPLPRRAGVHSFGYGGTIVHILLQEPDTSCDPPDMPDAPQIFVLSAKNDQRLRVYAKKLTEWLQELGLAPHSPSLADIAFTLQLGREPMQERLAVIAHTREELICHLEDFLANREGSLHVMKGNVKAAHTPSTVWENDEDERSYLSEITRKGKLQKIVSLWVQGARVDWHLLHQGNKRRRVSLPTYPFAPERHWAPEADPTATTIFSPAPHAARTSVEWDSRNFSPDTLERDLRALIAGFLKIEEDHLPVDEKLTQFGMDSVVLIRLVRRLKATYGVDVSLKSLVENPTIRGMAQYLLNQNLATRVSQPAVRDHRAAPVGALKTRGASGRSDDSSGNGDRNLKTANSSHITEQDAEELLARLDRLSDEEVEALLGRYEAVKY